MPSVRNTKIVATLGPASNSLEMIRKLYQAGVNVFRLNFSHGTYEDHAQAIQRIRTVEEEFGRPVAIMLDLQGPKLRIGNFQNTSIDLKVGQRFQLDLNEAPGDETRVLFKHPAFYKSLVPGTDILLDDGKVLLRVEEQYADRIVAVVLNGRELSNHKGVNLPGVLLEINAMTEKDQQDLAFGLQHHIDWVAVSFVQSAQDIIQARAQMPSYMKVIAKIEKPLAIQNLDSIIDAADGLMVARGDLGVEVPLEQVPGLQKKILHACHIKGKPVVVATQMLDSMVQAPSPTRAEVSDVANAVCDGADAVMLSAESASGLYPEAAVQMMDRIIRQVEEERKNDAPISLPFDTTTSTPLIAAIPQIATSIPIAAISALSETGACVRKVARVRPNVPIFTISADMHTARYLQLVWGVQAFYAESLCPKSFDELISLIQTFLREKDIVHSGDDILIVTGRSFSSETKTSTLHLVRI